MNYEILKEIREWAMLIAEWVIVYILVIEYLYDKAMNEHVKALKKRTKRRFDFEMLNEGEGR